MYQKMTVEEKLHLIDKSVIRFGKEMGLVPDAMKHYLGLDPDQDIPENHLLRMFSRLAICQKSDLIIEYAKHIGISKTVFLRWFLNKLDAVSDHDLPRAEKSIT